MEEPDHRGFHHAFFTEGFSLAEVFDFIQFASGLYTEQTAPS